MTITQMLYFQAVCRNSSVTKAAQILNISQPALSNAIKDLENEFGLNLFHRRSKRFILTKEGEYFLSKVTPLLEAYGEMTSNMKSFAGTRNTVKLGIQAFASTVIAPHLLTDFHKKYPEIKFDLQELPSHLITQNISNGTLDIGLVNLSAIGETAFDSHELYSVPFYFCIRKDHPLARYEELKLSDVADFPLVLPSNSQYSPTGILSSFKKAGIAPNVLFYTAQYSAIIEYIRSGIVGGFLCEEIISPYDDIAKIKIDGINPQSIGIISRKSSHVYADTAKFIDFVRDWVFEHPCVGGLMK